LPFETPRGLLFTLAFITGLSVDIFCNTPGMHLLPTLFMAGLRQSVLMLFFAKEELESNPPSGYSLGLWRFMRYAMTLTLAHHFLLFLLESFTLFNLTQIVLKTITSVLFTLFFIFCIETIKMARR
jgi:rod shape-determining protein MreD